jgi:hypothetical protein
VSYLIDTNVISELRKGERADPGVRSWISGVADGELFLSVLVLGELRRGVERIRRRDRASASALDAWLRRLLIAHRERILPITAEIAEAWALLNVPDPLPVIDSLLAATAQIHGLTLVTRNTRDMARTGVRMLNPFEPTAR